MNDVINTLQTLALALTLMIVLFVLLWSVYAFRQFVRLFNKLVEEMDQRVVAAPKIEQKIALEPAIQEDEEVPEPVSKLPRQKCKTCEAKLPELPTQSYINGTSTTFVFKCKRCGKETEVDLTQNK